MHDRLLWQSSDVKTLWDVPYLWDVTWYSFHALRPCEPSTSFAKAIRSVLSFQARWERTPSGITCPPITTIA